MNELRAATRDASFNASGRSRLWIAHHVVNPDDPHYVSACGRLLAPETEVLAVGARLFRCGRPGCKQAWQRVDAENQSEGPR